ncbi:acyltransferase family protein [Streptomyces sp. NPDC001380]|uniref:acyltransferase family protein n=1 Tax=Streptomyces sp. NPDC001380 TaxID=3364566 RepID=UPI0036B11B47
MSTSTLPAPPGRALPEPSAPRTPPAGRDAFLDNAKLLGVVLVVLGHTWGPLAGDPGQHRALRAAYILVYTFHMPLFVMICGWFSRSFAENASHPGRLRRLVTSTLVPYLLFAPAYTLLRNHRQGHWTALQLLNPWYLTWFLVALFVWRVTAPVWRTVRAPVAVAVAAMLAVGATQPSGDLALGQVVHFLPFFVLGLTVRPAHLERLRASRWLRRAAVPVLAAGYACCYHLAPSVRTEWLYRRTGHERLHTGLGTWMLTTTLLAAAAFVLSVAFLALVPRRENRLTSLGAGSQYTYLLHGLLVQAALLWGWYRLGFTGTWSGQILLTAAAVATALLLAVPPVRRLTRWAVEPEMRWAFRDA